MWNGQNDDDNEELISASRHPPALCKAKMPQPAGIHILCARSSILLAIGASLGTMPCKNPQQKDEHCAPTNTFSLTRHAKLSDAMS
jgi:hypothetical protein